MLMGHRVKDTNEQTVIRQWRSRGTDVFLSTYDLEKQRRWLGMASQRKTHAG